MVDKRVEFLEIYKTTRSAIEHFDRLIGDFRKIVFAVNGIFVSAGLTFSLNPLDEAASAAVQLKYVKLFWVCNALIVINILIWLLEKHYHRYLITASYVAKDIEEELFQGRFSKCLTYQLTQARRFVGKPELFSKRRIFQFLSKKIWRFIPSLQLYLRSYDFMYILPMGSAGAINIYLGYLAMQYANNRSLFIVSIINFIIFLILTFLIVRFNYTFEKEFPLSFEINKSKQNQDTVDVVKH